MPVITSLHLEKFQESDRRLTPQRQAVLKAFMELSREHPTAETIYHAARRYCPTVGRATVYRTLDLFTQMGIIVKAPTLNGSARYEMNRSPHSHFVCLKCGRTYEFQRTQEPLGKYTNEEGFEVLSTSTIFFGYCPACRE
ncbi:transcriptional repressor [Neomoorella humiferrea]|uniref:Transcriptional regulator PerR n=1 Tax=Neomoorella humiferrea TaxID=676965 RepID=A0A2T0AK77_9FIRM|nr:transcriptional repressor [Moorella humiferrea]PRR68990.1 Transcriptional regulator PerR [Moorella humiferrea]